MTTYPYQPQPTPPSQPPQPQPQPKKKTGLIITIVASAAAFIIAFVICFFLFFDIFSEDESKSTSAIQANMSSWGYTAFNGKFTYVTDYATGIYAMDTAGNQSLLIEGIYSELGLVGDTLYCSEYIYTDDPADDRSAIVGINIYNKNKTVIYKTSSSETELIGSNVIHDCYYFTENSDTLFRINRKGELEETGFDSVLLVSDSGIYCSKYEGYGLKLLDFNGQTLTDYPELAEYIISTYFELGDYVYIGFDDEYSFNLYRLHKVTGELTPLTTDTSIFENNWLSYLNYYEDTLYVSTAVWYEDNSIDYAVYSMDLNGEHVRTIFTTTDTCGWGVPFCPLNVSDHYLVIAFPLSEMDIEIIDLNTSGTAASN